MTGDPDRELVEAALEATDGGHVDWDRLRRAMPGESGTLDALVAIAALAAAHRGPVEAEESPPPGAHAPAAFHWGPLEVRRLLGKGSYGEVFLAWDPRLEREVALKLHHAGPAEQSRRWLEEARRLARVRHPNVVAIYGAEVHDGRAGTWMALLRGHTLEGLLRVLGPLGAREAAHVGIEACSALAAVHAAGLVHNDVKLRNLMREGVPGQGEGAGRIVLTDFGSAHAHAPDVGDGESPPGTPLFTAPEVLAGARPTPASDLYALGVVLYRLLTGRYPIEARSLRELEAAHARGEHVSPRAVRGDLPPGLVAAIERALAPDPRRRFASAAEMERALLAVAGTEPTMGAAAQRTSRLRTRAGLALAGAAALLALVAVTAWVSPRLTRATAAWRAGPPALAARSTLVLEGRIEMGYFGWSLAALPDLDGDGHGELLVGAPSEENRGRVFLFSLADTGAREWWTSNGAGQGDAYGYAVSGIGDVNGDGREDFAVGANYHDGGGRDAGYAEVWFGGPTLGVRPDVVIPGSRPLQDLGFVLDGAGDLNADGFDDLVVGAPLDDQAGFFTGRAFVYYGGAPMDSVPDLVLTCPVQEAQFGIAVRGLGDFNADGHDDLAVGANWDDSDGYRAGRVYIYYGGPGVDARADLVLKGRRPREWLGMLGRPGDLDGDGHPDLPVGAHFAEGPAGRAGAVRIYRGGPQPPAEPAWELYGDEAGEEFGFQADASADVDGDGFHDVVVGAMFHDGEEEGIGHVQVFLGGPAVDAVPDLTVYGEEPRGRFGAALATVLDPEGGFADLLVGAPTRRGAVRVGGAVQRYDLERWHLLSPAGGERWRSGSRATLTWTGRLRADIDLSVDGGRSWRPVARRSGGSERNSVHVPVPAGTTHEALVRLVPSDRRHHGEVVARVAIDAGR